MGVFNVTKALGKVVQLPLISVEQCMNALDMELAIQKHLVVVNVMKDLALRIAPFK
eukprot:CAMPEP_0171524346 /NCGR_PEP_ID=MMETSP0959-20130129/8997_1 /TAXON_ID=87120 /ORGANISM="Aurantiochytrium limacinum, Strain ATCCMYA-1381" /LENGTH=55 /DNA_ID=CAMNT_0012065069 /DNA_START=118 /DNA_END=285 /DNA_ORIENTATION=-